MRNIHTDTQITITFKAKSATPSSAGSVLIYDDNPLYDFVASIADNFGRVNYSIAAQNASLRINFNPKAGIRSTVSTKNKKSSKEYFCFVFNAAVAGQIRRVCLEQAITSSPLHIANYDCRAENGSMLTIEVTKNELVKEKNKPSVVKDTDAHQRQKQEISISNDTINKLAASISTKAAGYINSSIESANRHITSNEERLNAIDAKLDKLLAVWEAD